MNLATKTAIALSLLGSLAACSDSDVGFGSEDDSEEVIAIKGFYQAIYRDDQLELAKQFASDRMDGLLEHYATIKNVERYVLGRYYDKVELTIDKDSLVPYLNNQQEIRATVMFDGQYKGDNIKDSRDVVLVLEEGQWRVDQILDPRYRP